MAQKIHTLSPFDHDTIKNIAKNKAKQHTEFRKIKSFFCLSFLCFTYKYVQ